MMDMAAKLSDLRQAIPGCHVAAFIDLSAKMVLAQDARSKAPQERIDGLADRAKRLLNAPGLTSLSPDHVMAVSADNLEVFLRAGPESDDALALVCGLDAPVAAAVEQSHALLKGLAAHD